jgi:hypothetical protein
VSVRVRVNATDLHKALAELRGQSPRAVTRALNRTIANVATRAGRETSQETGLPVRRVRDAMKTIRATFSSLRAFLQVRGFRIPLIQFKARQTRRGVSYTLPRGRGVAPGAFIRTMASGHTGVFMRKGKTRLPIKELFGPSLPKAFLQAQVQRALREVVDANLGKNLAHEIQNLLRRRGAA